MSLIYVGMDTDKFEKDFLVLHCTRLQGRITELEKERDARDLEQQAKGFERVLCENSLSLVKRERMVLKQIMKQLHEKAKALKEQGECE